MMIIELQLFEHYGAMQIIERPAEPRPIADYHDVLHYFMLVPFCLVGSHAGPLSSWFTQTLSVARNCNVFTPLGVTSINPSLLKPESFTFRYQIILEQNTAILALLLLQLEKLQTL